MYISMERFIKKEITIWKPEDIERSFSMFYKLSIKCDMIVYKKLKTFPSDFCIIIKLYTLHRTEAVT